LRIQLERQKNIYFRPSETETHLYHERRHGWKKKREYGGPITYLTVDGIRIGEDVTQDVTQRKSLCTLTWKGGIQTVIGLNED